MVVLLLFIWFGRYAWPSYRYQRCIFTRLRRIPTIYNCLHSSCLFR